MAKQSKAQRETVGRVMHEFKEGELRIRGKGPKVKNPKQAVAIALHEAGASREQSPQEKRRSLQKTKAKERKGETAQARTEGKRAATARRTGTKRTTARTDGATTKADLYQEARRRDIPGRSRMSKAQLERALRR
jgi:hypothetical protein